jgi:hypothetical protein
MSLILQDSGSGLWQVTVNDFGVLSVTSVGSGTPNTVDLNDSGNTTSWLLGVSTIGVLTTTSIAFNAGYSKSYALVSISGLTTWLINVTNFGDIGTSQYIPLASGIGGSQIMVGRLRSSRPVGSDFIA